MRMISEHKADPDAAANAGYVQALDAQLLRQEAELGEVAMLWYALEPAPRQ
jgi:hypothetical protein